MTRQEAIRQLQSLHEHCRSMILDEYEDDIWVQDVEALDLALSAIRPVSREQVEKVWRGEWEWYDEEIGSPLEGIEREWGWRCSKCKAVLPDDFDDPDNPPAMRFCQWFGAPMTDEAVEMMLERWKEAVDGETD